MELLEAIDVLPDLVCPACASDDLHGAAAAQEVRCAQCGRSFPCRRGVVDFVLPEQLNADSRREHATNAVDLGSARAVRRRTAKGRGNAFLMAQTRRAMRAVDALLTGFGDDCTLVSIGSGTGFELPILLRLRRFKRVYSSDLAWSTTALVPEVTRELDGDLGLFAADFDHLPIRRRPDQIGLVFLALHHAQDPHRSLANLLERSFDHLVLVEPVTNWLVALLARVGLARRVEYSGAAPQWLEIRTIRRIARANGYRLRVTTWWEIPRDRVPRRIRRSRVAWRPLYAVVEGISLLGRPLHFGSMAAVLLTRAPRG